MYLFTESEMLLGLIKITFEAVSSKVKLEDHRRRKA